MDKIELNNNTSRACDGIAAELQTGRSTFDAFSNDYFLNFSTFYQVGDIFWF